jgi:hypothetical protein
MAWFIPFLIIVAIAWAVVGVLLAKWLKQAGHARPFKRREFSGRNVYGGGVGFGSNIGSVRQGSRGAMGFGNEEVWRWKG